MKKQIKKKRQVKEQDKYNAQAMLRIMFDEDDLFDLYNDGGDPCGLND